MTRLQSLIAVTSGPVRGSGTRARMLARGSDVKRPTSICVPPLRRPRGPRLPSVPIVVSEREARYRKQVACHIRTRVIPPISLDQTAGQTGDQPGQRSWFARRFGRKVAGNRSPHERDLDVSEMDMPAWQEQTEAETKDSGA